MLFELETKACLFINEYLHAETYEKAMEIKDRRILKICNNS